jgi:hypothetical protein
MGAQSGMRFSCEIARNPEIPGLSDEKELVAKEVVSSI